MSALTPLYLLGVLAVAAPIIFHLIRRSPRGEVPFSSLIFLSPSPPRLTRRSRLDNILLLLLLRRRCSACWRSAFARPFLREAAHWNLGEDTSGGSAVLIDTSAEPAARRSLGQGPGGGRAGRSPIAGPTDELAVFAFDRDHPAGARLPRVGVARPCAVRQAVALARLDGLEPSWAATDLGQALIDAVAAIEDVADSSERTGRMPRRIVLVSDLQQGSRLEALGEFEWPSDVELEIKTVSDDSSNAGLQRLADPVEADDARRATASRRVRVFNDAESRRERFALQWTGPSGTASATRSTSMSRPARAASCACPGPKGPATARAIVLKGDAARVRQHAVHPRRAEGGGDRPLRRRRSRRRPDRPALLPDARLHRHAAADGQGRRPAADRSRCRCDPEHPTPLVILTAETSPENARRLRDERRRRRDVALRRDPPGPGARPSRPWRMPRPGRSRKRPVRARRPDQRDRLRSPAVRAVRRRRSTATSPRSISGSTASSSPRQSAVRGPGPLRERRSRRPREDRSARGSVVVMASGWNPADSQLARSSKFVPMMADCSTVTTRAPFDAEEHTVGDRDRAAPPRTDPGGTGRAQAIGGDRRDGAGRTSAFDQTDEPGVYTVDRGRRPAIVRREPRPVGEQDLGARTSRRWSSSAAGWPIRRGTGSTGSSSGSCTTPSWKVARSSGGG